VAAKLATYAVVGAGYGIVCTVVVATIATVWLPAKGIDLSLVGNGLPARMAGGVVAVAIFAVIGVGLGALLREQVATVVTLLVYLYVVEPIVTRIPALADWSIYLPGPAGSSLTGIALTGQTFLAAWQGALVLAAYGAGFATVGTWLAMRRDVS
jgi:hypothetical protein